MDIVKIENIVESKIIELRGQKVLVDSDVAQLYGVETKRINEAVKNNPERFPDGFVFELTNQEKVEVVENFDHLHSIKFSKVNPKVFSEQGLYMLATILKSPKAIETTIAIIKIFTQVREIKRAIMDVVKNPEEELKQKTLLERAGQLIGKLIMPTNDDMEIVESETKHELSVLVGYKFTRINRMKRKKQ
jgi:hypothetical protein